MTAGSRPQRIGADYAGRDPARTLATGALVGVAGHFRAGMLDDGLRRRRASSCSVELANSSGRLRTIAA